MVTLMGRLPLSSHACTVCKFAEDLLSWRVGLLQAQDSRRVGWEPRLPRASRSRREKLPGDLSAGHGRLWPIGRQSLRVADREGYGWADVPRSEGGRPNLRAAAGGGCSAPPGWGRRDETRHRQDRNRAKRASRGRSLPPDSAAGG